MLEALFIAASLGTLWQATQLPLRSFKKMVRPFAIVGGAAMAGFAAGFNITTQSDTKPDATVGRSAI